MKSQQNKMMPDSPVTIETALASEAIDKLLNTYIPWIEKALKSLDEARLWNRPNENTNSIGNLLLHLEGNVRQWIIHGLGGVEDNRRRDSEFQAQQGQNASDLFETLRATVEQACSVIENYRNAEALLSPKVIQGFETTAYSAIFHVVEHFSYHTGQIVWICKAESAKDMKFYNL